LARPVGTRPATGTKYGRRGWPSGTSGRCFAVARARPSGAGLAEPLTGRELEVLRLLAAGKFDQRIAHNLFVAPDTVKKHVTYILGKLGATDLTEASDRARQSGLIP
jgi:DNA-binding NarL/FixJ family response regulator